MNKSRIINGGNSVYTRIFNMSPVPTHKALISALTDVDHYAEHIYRIWIIWSSVPHQDHVSSTNT